MLRGSVQEAERQPEERDRERGREMNESRAPEEEGHVKPRPRTAGKVINN